MIDHIRHNGSAGNQTDEHGDQTAVNRLQRPVGGRLPRRLAFPCPEKQRGKHGVQQTQAQGIQPASEEGEALLRAAGEQPQHQVSGDIVLAVQRGNEMLRRENAQHAAEIRGEDQDQHPGHEDQQQRDHQIGKNRAGKAHGHANRCRGEKGGGQHVEKHHPHAGEIDRAVL